MIKIPHNIIYFYLLVSLLVGLISQPSFGRGVTGLVCRVYMNLF